MVAVGVELDDVGADGWVGKGVENIEDLAGGEAAGLVVGDARSEGRVEDVEVEREIEGCLVWCQVSHSHNDGTTVRTAS